MSTYRHGDRIKAERSIDNGIEFLVLVAGIDREDLETYLESSVEMAFEEKNAETRELMGVER